MFETLKRLYDTGKLDREGLLRAVAKGWITGDEAEMIESGVEG